MLLEEESGFQAIQIDGEWDWYLVYVPGPVNNEPGVAEGRWSTEFENPAIVAHFTKYLLVTATAGGEWTVVFTRPTTLTTPAESKGTSHAAADQETIASVAGRRRARRGAVRSRRARTADSGSPPSGRHHHIRVQIHVRRRRRLRGARLLQLRLVALPDHNNLPTRRVWPRPRHHL